MAILLTIMGIEIVAIFVLGIINKDYIDNDTSYLEDC